MPGRKFTSRSSAIFSSAMLGVLLLFLSVTEQANAQSVAENRPDAALDALAAIKAENERLRGLFPSQSHAMMDVSYHFTNLWFAGQHDNWPLALFYLGETRNHIKWAIRLVPVRKTKAGELKLQELFELFDSSKLAEIQKQITAKDRKQFNAAYRDTLTGCNDCHVKADKPYLHMVVPDRPEAHGIDFNSHKDSQ